jgi:hypothetical protein
MKGDHIKYLRHTRSVITYTRHLIMSWKLVILRLGLEQETVGADDLQLIPEQVFSRDNQMPNPYPGFPWQWNVETWSIIRNHSVDFHRGQVITSPQVLNWTSETTLDICKFWQHQPVNHWTPPVHGTVVKRFNLELVNCTLDPQIIKLHYTAYRL